MKPVTIVALALSEGGMLPLQQFFDDTPLDKTAYIILTHLPPGLRSKLAGMLNRHSALEITDAQSGDMISSNKVYVLEQSRLLTIQRNRLLLSRQPADGATHTADIFFTSLAKNKQSKIAAVLLSGRGRDGSRGIAAVKKANGLVLAQDPRTSDFPQMPASAISTGLVDYVVEPDQMPALLTRWTENKFLPFPYDGATAPVLAEYRRQLLRQMGMSIRQIRLERNIPQHKLAALAGMQKASLCRIEKGGTNIKMVSLFRVASALGIRIPDFF